LHVRAGKLRAAQKVSAEQVRARMARHVELLAGFNPFDPDVHSLAFETLNQLGEKTLCRVVVANAPEPLTPDGYHARHHLTDRGQKRVGEMPDRHTRAKV